MQSSFFHVICLDQSDAATLAKYFFALCHFSITMEQVAYSYFKYSQSLDSFKTLVKLPHKYTIARCLMNVLSIELILTFHVCIFVTGEIITKSYSLFTLF